MLYMKHNELDTDYSFPTGVRLLKDVPNSLRLDVSPFRENSDYGTIYESVTKKYFPSLPNRFSEDQIQTIQNQWEKRMNFLADPGAVEFEMVDIRCLKGEDENVQNRGTVTALTIGDNRNNNPVLRATFFDVENSSSIVNDLEEDDTVVFYTDQISSRPWIGLCISCDNKNVEVQWLQKRKNQYVPQLNSDNSKYTSLLSVETVMFSNVLENVSEKGDRNGPYKLSAHMKRQIVSAYHERDKSAS